EIELCPSLERMVVAAGTLELHAEKRLADRLAGVLRLIAVLVEIHWRAVVDAVPLGLEQCAHPLVVRLILLELFFQPADDALPAIGFISRWIPAKENLVPHFRLMPGIPRVR